MPPKTRLWMIALAALSCTGNAFAAEQNKLPSSSPSSNFESFIAKGIIVDLREPTFKDGTLSTTEGGVIKGENIRIQARKIEYIRKTVNDTSIINVIAEGDVMVDYNNQIFVGERLQYDFVTGYGLIYNGRTAIDPWFIGASEIKLLPDGSYSMKKAFISTSVNVKSEWQISAIDVIVKSNRLLSAKNVHLRFLQLPVFWLPSFSANVDNLLDSPVKYRAKWGGGQGPRLNMRYRFFSQEDWKSYFVLDYSVKRGWGGGIDILHKSKEQRKSFFIKNYVAYDSVDKKQRYRFDGLYSAVVNDGTTFLDASYDRLSDNDMSSDYHDKDFDLSTAGLTHVSVWHRNPAWIASGLCRVRINDFQTIKQEIPSLEMSWRPLKSIAMGTIVDHRIQASYVDLHYAKNLDAHFKDINSVRLSLDSDIYRPISLHNHMITVTPQVGLLAVYYGNTPTNDSKTVAIAKASIEAMTTFSKFYGDLLHTSEPYMRYTYYSKPTATVNTHYIFDINDGISQLNVMSLGIRNDLYRKNLDNGEIQRDLFIDIYGNTFFSARAFDKEIPKIHGDMTWLMRPNLTCSLNTIWNIEKNDLDRINVTADWTFNEDFAAGVEYRHRGAYDWLKADRTNYLLETLRSEEELLSSLSDKNDTILTKVCYRFMPNWTCTVRSRHTRKRIGEPNINEYNINIVTLLRSNWEISTSYLHRLGNTSFSLRLSLPRAKPKNKFDNPDRTRIL